MLKSALISQINNAFKGVTLDSGIGLWEGQGLDDYASAEACKKLRERDEKDEWSKIPVIDLYRCSSSLSFFDPLGMRFHLPQFLLFDLDVFEAEEDALFANGSIESCMTPEVFFTLTHRLDNAWSITRFSALNNPQIQCIIDYFYYQLEDINSYRKEHGYQHTSKSKVDEERQKINEYIAIWSSKLS